MSSDVSKKLVLILSSNGAAIVVIVVLVVVTVDFLVLGVNSVLLSLTVRK